MSYEHTVVCRNTKLTTADSFIDCSRCISQEGSSVSITPNGHEAWWRRVDNYTHTHSTVQLLCDYASSSITTVPLGELSRMLDYIDVCPWSRSRLLIHNISRPGLIRKNIHVMYQLRCTMYNVHCMCVSELCMYMQSLPLHKFTCTIYNWNCMH